MRRMSTSELLAKKNGTSAPSVPRPAAGRTAEYFADGHICALDPRITAPYLDPTQYKERVMVRFVKYSYTGPSTGANTVSDGATKVSAEADKTVQQIKGATAPLVKAAESVRGVISTAKESARQVVDAAKGTPAPAAAATAAPAPAPAAVAPKPKAAAVTRTAEEPIDMEAIRARFVAPRTERKQR